MSDLATSGAAESASLADRIRWEVIIQHKAAFDLSLLEIIHVLLVHLRPERRGNDRLRLTACE